MISEKFIFFGLLIQVFGSLYYFKDILRGTTRPNLVSWLVWTLSPFVGAFLQFKAGAGILALPIFMGGLISLSVIALSSFKKNAFWELNNLDLVCGVFSIIALGLYIITHHLGISIVFAIASDSLAYLPIFRKLWNFPNTETPIVYLTGIVSNILVLLTLKEAVVSIYSFNLAVIILNLVVVFCVYRKKII